MALVPGKRLCSCLIETTLTASHAVAAVQAFGYYTKQVPLFELERSLTGSHAVAQFRFVQAGRLPPAHAFGGGIHGVQSFLLFMRCAVASLAGAACGAGELTRTR